MNELLNLDDYPVGVEEGGKPDDTRVGDFSGTTNDATGAAGPSVSPDSDPIFERLIQAESDTSLAALLEQYKDSTIDTCLSPTSKGPSYV